MADSELDQFIKIGASGGRNPVQETSYQELNTNRVIWEIPGATITHPSFKRNWK